MSRDGSKKEEIYITRPWWKDPKLLSDVAGSTYIWKEGDPIANPYRDGPASYLFKPAPTGNRSDYSTQKTPSSSPIKAAGLNVISNGIGGFSKTS